MQIHARKSQDSFASPQVAAAPDWNELRIVLALSRAGTLAAAAGALGVNLTTVFRRLNAIEARLGQRLFDRGAAGYQATAAGERMVRAAERVEEEVAALDRAMTGGDLRLQGRLRVTSSETLAYRLLTRHLADFGRTHPGIRLELAIDNRLLSLSKREADVALRASRPHQPGLYGRKIAEIAWAVYASRDYAKAHGLPDAPKGMGQHRVIGWDEGAEPFRAVEWLEKTVPVDAIVYRSSSLVNQLVAVKAGMGVAVLPCYLADPEPDLVRALAPIEAIRPELWLITHADLKYTARVRAFLDVVGAALLKDRPLLEGEHVPRRGGKR